MEAERTSWPIVAVVTVFGTLITVMLSLGVEVTSIISVFSLLSGALNVMLYGKLQKVESNTNGAMSEKDALIRELIDTIKKSPPIVEE